MAPRRLERGNHRVVPVAGSVDEEPVRSVAAQAAIEPSGDDVAGFGESTTAHRDGAGPELAEPFEMSLPAVSKHLRVLVDARLIQKERDGRLHRCSLEPGSLRPANDWIQHYRRFWEESFDSLEEYLDGNGAGAGAGAGAVR